MRLVELIQPNLYIATNVELKVGEPISMDNSVYHLGWALEGRIDARRPDESLPRNRTLYLHSWPPDGAYAYVVKPIGKVDRNHTGWLRRLEDQDLAQIGEIDRLSTGYWSGEMLPDARHEPFEYRCLQATIVREIRAPNVSVLAKA